MAFGVIGTPNDRVSAEKLAADEPHQFQYWITQAIDGQPFQGGRKGMDRGIDGYVCFTGHDRKTDAAIISVKAGRDVGVAMVRDLKGVVEREKAPIGIFVCVINPTREMEREAASAGVYEGATAAPIPACNSTPSRSIFWDCAPGCRCSTARPPIRKRRASATASRARSTFNSCPTRPSPARLADRARLDRPSTSRTRRTRPWSNLF